MVNHPKIPLISFLIFCFFSPVDSFSECYRPCPPGQKHQQNPPSVVTVYAGGGPPHVNTRYYDKCINNECSGYPDDLACYWSPTLPGQGEKPDCDFETDPSCSGYIPPGTGDPGDGTEVGGEGGYGGDDGGECGLSHCMPNKDGSCDDGYNAGTVDGYTVCVQGQSQSECPKGYNPSSTQPSSGSYLTVNTGYCIPDESNPDDLPDIDNDGCPNNYTKVFSMPSDGRHFYQTSDGKYCIAGDGSLPEDKIGPDGLPRDKDGDGVNDDGTEQGNPTENDKDADGQPDEPEDSTSASGGGKCNVAPRCDGDPIQCATLMQQWRDRCANEKNNELAEKTNEILEKEQELSEGRNNVLGDISDKTEAGNDLLGQISEKLDDNDTVSGGNDCTSPPVCEGNAVECAQLRQLWEQRCANEGNTLQPANEPTDLPTDYLEDPAVLQAKQELLSKITDIKQEAISLLGFQLQTGAGALPCESFTVFGHSYELCLQQYAYIFDMLAIAILFVASVISFNIVFSKG